VGEDGVTLEGRIVGDGLRERAEEDRAEIFAKEAGFDVVGDADDFVGDAATGDGLADGILVGEECIGEDLVDDGDAGRSGGLASGPPPVRRGLADLLIPGSPRAENGFTLCASWRRRPPN
jgi:hypothetical protein